MSIAASLIVTFGDTADSNALVIIEADDILNINAAEEVKTQFSPGDDYYFLIHHADSLRIDSVKTTGGMIVSQGAASRERSNELLWYDLDTEHDLTYIPTGGISADWYWREATGLQKLRTKEAGITAAILPVEGLIEYQVSFRLYKLLTPVISLANDETRKITIVAHMEAAE